MSSRKHPRKQARTEQAEQAKVAPPASFTDREGEAPTMAKDPARSDPPLSELRHGWWPGTLDQLGDLLEASPRMKLTGAEIKFARIEGVALLDPYSYILGVWPGRDSLGWPLGYLEARLHPDNGSVCKLMVGSSCRGEILEYLTDCFLALEKKGLQPDPPHTKESEKRTEERTEGGPAAVATESEGASEGKTAAPRRAQLTVNQADKAAAIGIALKLQDNACGSLNLKELAEHEEMNVLLGKKYVLKVRMGWFRNAVPHKTTAGRPPRKRAGNPPRR